MALLPRWASKSGVSSEIGSQHDGMHTRVLREVPQMSLVSRCSRGCLRWDVVVKNVDERVDLLGVLEQGKERINASREAKPDSAGDVARCLRPGRCIVRFRYCFGESPPSIEQLQYVWQLIIPLPTDGIGQAERLGTERGGRKECRGESSSQGIRGRFKT